jgi:cardiolipin synthase
VGSNPAVPTLEAPPGPPGGRPPGTVGDADGSDGVAGPGGSPSTLRPESEVSSRVLTLPNLLSFLRLLGVPLFVYLVLGPHADGWALAVLIYAGFSDYLDGKLARAWNQVTRVGQLLDPLADRLYIAATVVALAVRGVIPWWLVAVLFARDLAIACLGIPLKRLGYGPLPVHFLGKAATFNLLYAFPMLLLGEQSQGLRTVFRPLGWAFVLWGTGLYLWSFVLYVGQVRGLARADRSRPADS